MFFETLQLKKNRPEMSIIILSFYLSHDEIIRCYIILFESFLNNHSVTCICVKKINAFFVLVIDSSPTVKSVCSLRT